jgi:hypothetical protein
MNRAAARALAAGALLLSALLPSAGAQGLAPLALPERESAEYLVTTGPTRSMQRETTVLEMTPVPSLRVTVESERQSLEMTFSRDGLVPISLQRTSRREGTTLETITRLTNPPRPAADEILVLDFTNLLTILRAFPFESPRTQRITLEGAQEQTGSQSWGFSVAYAGRETVSTAGRAIDCHKLSLVFKATGLMSLFAGMVPKTTYWFSAAPPHYCVKYTGVSGPPGSPEVTRIITAYSGW